MERLWRTIKYEEVYLRAYASASEAPAGIGRYIGFYNTVRPHSALRYRSPAPEIIIPMDRRPVMH